uniref:Ig-like domain-containing protein n=1 Tax=Otus sunia TaxID=257818 RepID=A0A8C8EEC2_9STRI
RCFAHFWGFLCFCTNLPLSQTPEHILAQTNKKTEILCELKEEYAGVYWYRWSHVRQNFEFLIFSNLLGKVTYGTNISQDKFSVHGASFRTSYSLHINHLHASDNGTYYCSVSQSSQLLLGSGTRLAVGKHHSWGSKMCHQQTVMRSPGKQITYLTKTQLWLLAQKHPQCSNLSFFYFFPNMPCTLSWLRNPFWILAGSKKSWFKIKENCFLSTGHISMCKAKHEKRG